MPSAPRSWSVAVVAAVALVAVAGAGFVPFAIAASPPPEPAAAPVTLPSRIGWVPPGVRSVHDAPPGPAIALVWGYGAFSERFLTVDATRNEVRELPEVVDRESTAISELAPGGGYGYSARLAPDGRRVAVGGVVDGPNGVLLVDLRTGKRRSYPTGEEFVEILAWSADSTRIAYATDQLYVLDLNTGRSTAAGFGDLVGRHARPAEEKAEVPELNVAFSPDGDRLAVEDGPAIQLVRVDTAGDAVRVPRQADEHLVPDVGWAPDGRRLALVSYQSTATDSFWADADLDDARVSFIDVTGTAPRRLPERVSVPGVYEIGVAGWRSPRELLIVVARENSTTVEAHAPGADIADVLLETSEPVMQIQLASALVSDLGTRPGGVNDGGPLSPRMLFLASAGSAALAYLVTGAAALLVVALAATLRRRTA